MFIHVFMGKWVRPICLCVLCAVLYNILGAVHAVCPDSVYIYSE